MTHPLDITYSIPLEREYEAWIVRGIEEYFLSIGQRISIWAVSPMDEVNWPADESMIIGKKLIGLQMKKVAYHNKVGNPHKFGRLNWTFHNPKGQYNLVVKFPEIFYCLPTFINRNYKEQALAHCIFWRPVKLKPNKNAWYDNPGAPTPYNSIGTSARWGKFVENIMECTIGKKIDSLNEAKTYVEGIRDAMKEASQLKQIGEEIKQHDEDVKQTGQELHTYILAIPID